jgi:hypothetical protein
MNRSARRAHLLISVELAIGAGVLAACGAYVTAGAGAAVIAGVVTGLGAWAGTLLVRRRVFAVLERAESEAGAQGYAEGLAQAVVMGVVTYEAAVFPLTGAGGVTDQERLARRTVAYRIAADDGLPHKVRTAAAAALEAIDLGEDRERAHDAVEALHGAVHQLRRAEQQDAT